MIGLRQPRNQSHHHKIIIEPHGRAVLLGSFTLLLSALAPFPKKSLALSAHVSPWTIQFQVLDKSPVSGPGRGPPSCNNTTLMAESEEELKSLLMKVKEESEKLA